MWKLIFLKKSLSVPVNSLSQLIYVGEYSRAMDAHWHPGHLCCFNCDESLSQQKFIIVENEPSCIKCYERNFANSCQNCGSSIGPGMKDVDVRGKHWHEDCFVCSECKKALVRLSLWILYGNNHVLQQSYNDNIMQKSCNDNIMHPSFDNVMKQSYNNNAMQQSCNNVMQ